MRAAQKTADGFSDGFKNTVFDTLLYFFTTHTTVTSRLYLEALNTSITAPRTITLPTAIGAPGKLYIIKDESGVAATNNITVATTSGQTIDNAASKSLNTNYGFLRVYSNGANWFSI